LEHTNWLSRPRGLDVPTPNMVLNPSLNFSKSDIMFSFQFLKHNHFESLFFDKLKNSIFDSFFDKTPFFIF